MYIPTRSKKRTVFQTKEWILSYTLFHLRPEQLKSAWKCNNILMKFEHTCQQNSKRRFCVHVYCIHITSSPITQQSHKQLHIATFPVVKMKLFTYVGLLFPVIVTEDKKNQRNYGGWGQAGIIYKFYCHAATSCFVIQT